MRFTFTEQQDALRHEIKEFFEKEWTKDIQRQAEARGEYASGYSPYLHKKMAEKGWLSLNWPKEYGGKGWSTIEMAIFAEEAAYHRAPLDAYGVTAIIGNAIIHMGSEEQKRRFLPKLAAGDLLLSIGYTEPDTGSDLASLETRAVLDGDEYLVNGVKIFNTGGHVANYCWLATRTDTQVAKHKGITVFLVDLKSPGVTIRPLHNVADGYAQDELIFQDVRVPKENMVGEKNRGWYVIAKALDIERLNMRIHGVHRRVLENLVKCCREIKRSGVPLIEDPAVRQQLVELHTEAKVARLLAYKVIYLQSKGDIPDVAASMAKLYGSELHQKIAHVGMRILGLRSIVRGESPWSMANGELNQLVRLSIPTTVAAGSSQIQRGIIATRGLGLPRG